MCRSMVDIKSAAVDIRQGIKRKKEEEERNHRAKIQWPTLFYTAAVMNNPCWTMKQFGMYTVSQKCHYFVSRYLWHIYESILIMFGRYVTEKVGNQKILYFPTSPMHYVAKWRNKNSKHPFTQMLNSVNCYSARLQPVPGLTYSVLLLATHARAVIWLSKSHSVVKLWIVVWSYLMRKEVESFVLQQLDCVECKNALVHCLAERQNCYKFRDNSI